MKSCKDVHVSTQGDVSAQGESDDFKPVFTLLIAALQSVSKYENSRSLASADSVVGFRSLS